MPYQRKNKTGSFRGGVCEPNHKKRTMTKKASYGIIETIGGFVMARSYTHIQQYEKEILELKEQGLTHKEVGEQLGFTQKQVKKFIERYRRKERKIAAGKLIKRKGRPPKDNRFTETNKVSELKYIIARKDAKIKALEMENELMRDFLSLTERK
jgi:DNA-binding CsgD family transcriptional regulator